MCWAASTATTPLPASTRLFERERERERERGTKRGRESQRGSEWEMTIGKNEKKMTKEVKSDRQ